MTHGKMGIQAHTNIWMKVKNPILITNLILKFVVFRYKGDVKTEMITEELIKSVNKRACNQGNFDFI